MNKSTLTTGIVACALGIVAVGVGMGDRKTPPVAAAATAKPITTPTPTATATATPTPTATPVAPVGQDRIQIALLLDTSGSMDGLISQARTQLWKVVNEYARAIRNGKRARLEIALYEYGNAGLSAESGFVRQILPFTSDLDRVSEELFALTTNGGEEYCGKVIQKATNELAWSKAPGDLRLVFIAGNEPFSQGPVDYHVAIAAARKKGIRINTIHCGGDEPSWRDGALVARGEYV
ncbi:MAG TPA: vWA domain-containing protein, partial [Dongiaceae bacterium]|nr:vWA domain-containing protein [Dongiaceae bacterium]